MEQRILIYEPSFALAFETTITELAHKELNYIVTDTAAVRVLQEHYKKIFENAWFHGEWPTPSIIPESLECPEFIEYIFDAHNYGQPVFPEGHKPDLLSALLITSKLLIESGAPQDLINEVNDLSMDTYAASSETAYAEVEAYRIKHSHNVSNNPGEESEYE